MTDEQNETKPARMDSYANLISLMGTQNDKSSFATFLRDHELTWQVLDAMYEQDGLAARIVDRLPDDATREGFTLDIEVDGLKSELQDLNAMGELGDAWRWARLYGGSLLLMVVNDGLKMEEPLDLANATKLSALNVIESRFANPAALNPGLGARAFRNPTWYDVTLQNIGAGNVKRVHRSRVIRFDGMRVPASRVNARNGWPPSVLDRVFAAISRLGQSLGYSANVMHEISMLVLKMKNLRSMLAGDDRSKSQAQAAWESIKWNMDTNHMLALDSEDELVELNRSVAGLCDLLDKFVDAVVWSTDMPRTVVLGEQPGGLNANGESEIRSWYDFVESQQDAVLTPALTRLLSVMFAIRRNNNESIPDEWAITYNPLWAPTQKEKAETLKTTGEALAVLIEANMLSPDEGRAMLVAAEMISVLDAPPDMGST